MSGPEPPPSYPSDQPPQYPQYPQQPYPAADAPPAGNDKTTLWGVLGVIIGLLCCGPAGIVFGILSINEASKHGKSKALGIVAIVLSVIGMIGSGIVVANR